MLGQIIYRTGRTGTPERVQVMGLYVLRAEWNPDRYWARRRLKKIAGMLRESGIFRVLVPDEFTNWDILRQFGLRGVDPIPFLRVHAAQIALAALTHNGKQPECCAVALRGQRAEREIITAAYTLSRHVREVCISAPNGGEYLEQALRRECGMAIRPDWPGVPVAVRFDPDTDDSGDIIVSLFPSGLDLAGVTIRPETGETVPLSLLAAAWEAGKMKRIKYS